MRTAERVKQEESLASVKHLRETITAGDTLYTVLRHVSPSGMTRWIDVYSIEDNAPHYLSGFAAQALQVPWNTRGHDGIERGGCGMDMGFDLVYSISRRLFPDGFPCIGNGCPSNAHSNGDRDYTPGHAIHKDGGYALKQRWL